MISCLQSSTVQQSFLRYRDEDAQEIPWLQPLVSCVCDNFAAQFVSVTKLNLT